MTFQELSRFPLRVFTKNTSEKIAARIVQKITTMPTICMICDMGLLVRAKVFKPTTASHVPINMPIFWAFSVAVRLLFMVVFL